MGITIAPGGGFRPPLFLREGGRGIHGPAPASASLYGFAADCLPRDCEPLFTSACWEGMVALARWRDAHAIRLPTALSAQPGEETLVQHPPMSHSAGPGRKVIPTTPPKPPKPGRAVFGSRERARRRGIDGPPEDSLRPKAVERSAGRRGTIDSSPFHTQHKEPLADVDRVTLHWAPVPSGQLIPRGRPC